MATDRGGGPSARAHAPGGAVVTVGAFDGIHLGHRALIGAAVQEARRRGLPAMVLTFFPHPAAVLRPDRPPALICTREEKLEAIAALGVDRLVFLPFTRALADLTAREFVARVLVERLGTRHLVIGHDHALGRDRVGDAGELRRLGDEFGFGVTVVDAVEAAGGAVSSTRIRGALSAGDARRARDLLGRPYWLTGDVVRGEGRGREIGVPTANLGVAAEKLVPAPGIYAIRAWVEGDGYEVDGRRYPASGPREAVLHIGPRPVFDDARPTIEAHLIGFSGDLYGKRLRVELVQRIRDVEDFESVESLVAAIRRDVRAAQEALTRPPLVRDALPGEY